MQGASKVGALILVFFALLYASYSLIGQSFLDRKRPRLFYAEFTDAGGLAPGAKVLMAGVKVGSVTKVRLANPKLARLTISMDQGISIPVGTAATVQGSLTGLGDTPLVLVPPDISSEADLPEGSTLKGAKGNPLESLLPNSKDAVGELTKTMAALRKWLEDDKLRSNSTELLATMNKTVEKFGGVADQTQLLMVQNRGSINGAIQQAMYALKNVNEATQVMAKLLKEGKFQNEALTLMDSLNKTTKRADKLVADLDSLVADPSLKKSITGTAANFEDITNTGKKIATNTEEMTRNGVTISKKAIEITDKASEIADEAKEVVKKLKGLFDKTGGGKAPQIHAEMDLMHEADPKRWRTDVNLSTPISGGKAYLGLYDAFEGNKINLQLGRTISPKMDIRYGIYASKPGVGVDYALAPGLKIRSDAYDINRGRFDIRAKYEFKNGIVGWLGLDQVFKRNTPSFGIGIIKD